MSLFAQVLPLAAGAAISPALLGLQVLNISRPRSPLARAWSVALGAALLLAAASLAALVFHLGTGGHRTSPDFPAAHEVAASREPDAVRVGAFLVVFAIAMLPAAVPPLALMVMGERVKAPLQALNDYVIAHRRGVTAVACLVFGAVLLVSGLIQLA